jgi:hypothetical protein
VVVIPAEKFKISTTSHIMAEGKIHVPPLNEVKRGIMNLMHNHPLAEHPRWDKTLRKTQEWYYWPRMKEWITNYIKGCAICQQNKVLTHCKATPTYWIPTMENA